MQPIEALASGHDDDGHDGRYVRTSMASAMRSLKATMARS